MMKQMQKPLLSIGTSAGYPDKEREDCKAAEGEGGPSCNLVYKQWLALGNYSSYWVVLLSLNVRAQSYLTLICHALLIPTGRLSLSEQK